MSTSTREKEELVGIWRVVSRPLLQAKTLRATVSFNESSWSQCVHKAQCTCDL